MLTFLGPYTRHEHLHPSKTAYIPANYAIKGPYKQQELANSVCRQQRAYLILFSELCKTKLGYVLNIIKGE